MLRFVVKEVYLGHVVHAGGQPETRIVSFDGDQEWLERFLRYEDQPGEKRPDHLTREVVGVEILDDPSASAARHATMDEMQTEIDRMTANDKLQYDEIRRLRETLHGIADADYRKWEELASPDEFVRWAKARAHHALTPN